MTPGSKSNPHTAARGRTLWRAGLDFCLAAGVLFLAGCATPPSPPPPPVAKVPGSYVVLLNNADGSTGQVKVSTRSGETVLATAGQASRLAGPAGQTFEVNRDKISQDFGAAMAASPVKPVSYLLYFLPGGARLAPESEADVAKILAAVAARPVPDLSIIGHTDTAGDALANERLGLERARYVAGLLTGTRLDPRNVTVESHGETNLLVATPDETQEPRNRRVEVTIR